MIRDLLNKRNEICEKAEKKEAEIKKAQKLLERYNERTRWFNSLLIPIAKAIVEREGFFKFQTMGPFGLSCSTSLWMWKTEEDYQAYKNNHKDQYKKLISIEFRPQGFTDENGKYRIGLAVVRSGESTGEYAEGTIGYVNGFNKPQIDIDDWDLDTLIAFMYDQNKKEEL